MLQLKKLKTIELKMKEKKVKTKKEKKEKKPEKNKTEKLKKFVKDKTASFRTLKKKKTSNSTKKVVEEHSDSSSENDEPENLVETAAANVKNLYMAGKLKSTRPNPSDYEMKLLMTERPDLFENNVTLTKDDCIVLDAYLKAKGEIRNMEFLVMKETGDEEEKTKDRLSVVRKYDEGRFGAIYVVQRVATVDNKVVFTAPGIMVMKTSLRQSSTSTSRLTREIEALKLINDCGKSKEPACKRVISILFESRVLGIPYFLMPPMDSNLEKIRQDLGVKFCSTCAFFIAQEILVGIKDIHAKKMVHRDIKPTNVVLHLTNRTQFWLIDFGDAVEDGHKLILSPPDGTTLPYLSLLGHVQTKELTPALMKQDLESWFYVLCDLLKPLPWRKETEEANVEAIKKDLWKSQDFFFAEYPSQIEQIGAILDKGVEYPYKTLSLALKEGYEKNKPNDWKPCWIDKRVNRASPAAATQIPPTPMKKS